MPYSMSDEIRALNLPQFLTRKLILCTSSELQHSQAIAQPSNVFETAV